MEGFQIEIKLVWDTVLYNKTDISWNVSQLEKIWFNEFGYISAGDMAIEFLAFGGHAVVLACNWWNPLTFRQNFPSPETSASPTTPLTADN